MAVLELPAVVLSSGSLFLHRHVFSYLTCFYCFGCLEIFPAKVFESPIELTMTLGYLRVCVWPRVWGKVSVQHLGVKTSEMVS